MGGCGFGVWWFFLKGPDADFRFVHDNVHGFISYRVADIMKSPAGKEQLDRMGKDQRKEFDNKLSAIEGKLGLTINDLERVTMIGLGGAATVIRTSKPMKREKILTAFSTKQEKKTHNNATYYVLDRKGRPMGSLHFASDNLVLMTDHEDTMKDFLANVDKPTTDPTLKRACKLASSGSYAMVGGFKGSALAPELAAISTATVEVTSPHCASLPASSSPAPSIAA